MDTVATTSTMAERVAVLEARTAMYGLLAGVMTRPYADTVARCTAAAAALATLPTLEPRIRAPLSRMSVHDTEETPLERLEVEYTRLFVNAYPKTPLPPYESVQRGEGGLWGDSTIDVARRYASAGLEFQKTHGVAPDHLSAEFEFAGALLASVHDATDPEEVHRLEEDFSQFFTAHLAPWAGEFCRKVGAQAHVEFYRAFGEAGAAFMAAETELLESERRAATHG